MSAPFLRTTGYSKKTVGPDGKVQRAEIIKPSMMRTVREAKLFIERQVNPAIENGELNPRDGIALFRSVYYKGTRLADLSKAARRAILCGCCGKEWTYGETDGIPFIAFKVDGGGYAELNYSPKEENLNVGPSQLLTTDPEVIARARGANILQHVSGVWIPVKAPDERGSQSGDRRLQFQKVNVTSCGVEGGIRASVGDMCWGSDEFDDD